MFEDCFLTFSEKLTLFTFEYRSKRKDKIKKDSSCWNLIYKYQFLEEFRSNENPPIIRLSDNGKTYILYRREKRFDRLVLPVTVSVVASLASTALLNFLM